MDHNRSSWTKQVQKQIGRAKHLPVIEANDRIKGKWICSDTDSEFQREMFVELGQLYKYKEHENDTLFSVY